MAKQRKQVVCCQFCGRDTPNKSGICKNCNGGRSRHSTNKPEVTDDDREALISAFGWDVGPTREQQIENEVERVLRDEME